MLLIPFLLILLTVYHIKKSRLPKDFPPGPRFPLPFVGDGYILGSDVTTGFQKLREKYGETFGLFIGSKKAVVLYDPELIIKAMAMDEIAGRGNLGDAILERAQGGPPQ